MKRFLFVAVLLLVATVTLQASESDSLKITFGRNEGMLAFNRIIREFGPQITAMVSRQLADSGSRIVVHSNADGVRYVRNDAKQNVVMTVERAVTGTTLLNYFRADMDRVTIDPLNNRADTGMAYRYIVFRLVPASVIGEGVPVLPERRPEVTAQPTVVNNYTTQRFKLNKVWLGGGLAVDPFGEVVPVVTFAVGNPTLSIEGAFGQSFSSFTPEDNPTVIHHQVIDAGFPNDEVLEVKDRYMAGCLVWHPLKLTDVRPALLAGVQRTERRAVKFGRYAAKLEGWMLGGRLELLNLFLSGYYARCEEDVYGRKQVENKDKFIFTAAFTVGIGGGKCEK